MRAVAKLDRMSRDVHLISGLMTHKVPLVVAELGTDARSFHAASVRCTRREGTIADRIAYP
jgi:hypothetical protein